MAYAAFTLSGFDDQERNSTFVKTAFQVLTFISSSQTKYCASLTTRKYFYKSFTFGAWLSNLHV